MKEIRSYIEGHGVKLVAVSKTKSHETVLQAYNSGLKIFGENRVQELVDKYHSLPKDIEWHMIGKLQINKVKYIAYFVSLIHSVDSFKLALVINKEAEKCNRTIDVLLQLKIGKEKTKSGFHLDLLLSDIEMLKELNNIRISGLMGIGTLLAG